MHFRGKTGGLLAGLVLAFIAAFVMAADSIPHPTPASEDGVSVGNGTSWTTKTLPSCTGTGQALIYNNSTNSFGCGSIQVNAFSAVCLDTPCVEVDSPPTNAFIGSAAGISGNISSVSCSWGAAGVGSGLIVAVYDRTSPATTCTCDLGACTGTFTPHACDCAGTMADGREYVFGIDSTSTCDTLPGEMFCNIALGP